MDLMTANRLQQLRKANGYSQDVLAEKLGKTRAQIKEMSTDGELTSDVIVNAVLDSTDKINSQFASMPMTWADVWTNIKKNLHLNLQKLCR